MTSKAKRAHRATQLVRVSVAAEMRSNASSDVRPKHRGAATALPAELIQASRFGKTRSAQSTALLEDYVELIADLLANEGEARPTDIARRLGVSHATAIKTVSRLKRTGLATARPYRGVFLTEKGEALAQRVPRSSSARCRRSSRDRSASRIRRGRCRRHRALCVGSDASGVFPLLAWSSLIFSA